MAKLKAEATMMKHVLSFCKADQTVENARAKAREAFDAFIVDIVKNGIRRDQIMFYFVNGCTKANPWPTADADIAEASRGKTKAGDLLGINKAASGDFQHPVAKRAKSFMTMCSAFVWDDDGNGLLLLDAEGDPLKTPSLTATERKQMVIDEYRSQSTKAAQAVIKSVTANNAWTADKLELAKALLTALGVRGVRLPKTVKRMKAA